MILTVHKITFVGHIVVASAKTSNQITAGMVIIGFGGALCQVRVIRVGQKKVLRSCNVQNPYSQLRRAFIEDIVLRLAIQIPRFGCGSSFFCLPLVCYYIDDDVSLNTP